MSLKYCVGVYLALTLVSFGSGGIRKELRSSQRVDLKESTIHLQHRIVHIIVIYVFCTLLKSYQYWLVSVHRSGDTHWLRRYLTLHLTKALFQLKRIKVFWIWKTSNAPPYSEILLNLPWIWKTFNTPP
jgi:hypothetical protein